MSDSTPEISYASLWRRLGAAIVDQIALTLANGVLGLILGIVLSVFLLSAGVPREAMLGATNVISSLLGLISCWAYFAVLESSEAQATFGKMLFSIQVASVHNQPISFARASGRYWSKVLFHLLCTLLSSIITGVLVFILLPDAFKHSIGGIVAGIFAFFTIFVVVLLLVQVAGTLAFYFFFPKRQLLHDLMAKTIVVKKPLSLGQIPS